jgi:hypothetical protein
MGCGWPGSSCSKNVVDANIKGLITVMNTASQKCKSDISQTQFLNISGGKGNTYNFTENWNQVVQFNSNCVQSIAFDTNVSQEASQEAQQIAQSISDFLALGSASAENVARLNQDLSIQVTNAFSQTCITNISQTQGVSITGGEGNTYNFFQDWSQFNNAMIDCVMNDKAVSNTSQKMVQEIDQSATAKAEGLGSFISGIIMVIIALIGLLVFGYMLIRGSGMRRDYTGGGTQALYATALQTALPVDAENAASA